MNSHDTMPGLVEAFERDPSEGGALLRAFMQHVAKVARPYPAAYFALGQKTADAVDDLGNRSFSSCAAIEKGRFPFSGRRPFAAFVEEQFDGRTIRYHAFYAKLSITREILRDDYAFNLRRDPVLRWRAELYADIGDILKRECTPVAQGRGVPPKWARRGAGIQMIRPLEFAVARVREQTTADLSERVLTVIELAGPQTQSRLTQVMEDVIGAPEADEPTAVSTAGDADERLGIRSAVAAAWQTLEPTDKALIIALAQGASYEQLIEGHPDLSNKVAVSRAVNRVGSVFLAVVLDAVGGKATPEATPRALLEPIMAVLAELYPRDFA
ncbi:MAG: hypothetical protein VX944_09465 [Myxococcota bacterium]|nr:hypothetical protein [Myxococcota bacterium]